MKLWYKIIFCTKDTDIDLSGKVNNDKIRIYVFKGSTLIYMSISDINV